MRGQSPRPRRKGPLHRPGQPITQRLILHPAACAVILEIRGEEVVTVAGASHGSAGETASVPVAVVASRIEADLIVGMLRSNGVRAVVSADDAGGQEPPLQIQGVRVLVTPSDAVPARQLIAEADDTPS